MEPWRTRITTVDDGHIWIHGHDLATLMAEATFADVVFLLHQGRLPSAGERRVLDAMLIAVADHGAGSPSAMAARTVATGNRASLEAAIAAGILAIGDAHGGAGQACMELIATALGDAAARGLTPQEAALLVVEDAADRGVRLPGLGHRVHATDPRTAVILDLAAKAGVARDGVVFMRALTETVRTRIRPLPLNIDGAIAAVLHDLHFAPGVGKLLFIVGRVAGLTAQVMEEHLREKAMRIRVPVIYEGVPPVVAGQ